MQVAGAIGLRPVEGLLLGAELLAATTAKSDLLFKKRSTPIEPLFGVHFDTGTLRAGIGASPGGLTNATGSPRARFLARIELAPAAPEAAPPPPPPAPADGDGDGVLDRDDACPQEVGVTSDDRSRHGCPAPADRDGDGVRRQRRRLPRRPRSKERRPRDQRLRRQRRRRRPRPQGRLPDDGRAAHAEAARNGCPLVEVAKEQIRIREQVQFAVNKATIEPASTELLQAIATVLREHPEIKKVRVEGHTDDRGQPARNKALSRRRADAVVRWLVKEGKIEASRLESEGVGSERPLGENETEEGRQANRRVELHIVDPAPGS